MKAPEKIWINPSKDLPKLCGHIDKYSVEYTPTDAFMKNAKEAFCKAMCDGNPPRSICTSLGTCKKHDNFVQYMKGE